MLALKEKNGAKIDELLPMQSLQPVKRGGREGLCRGDRPQVFERHSHLVALLIEDNFVHKGLDQ